jgi:acetyl-CoA C-acetyltransferase
MDDVVIVAAGRTAVGKFGGSLAKTSAADLGAHVIKGLMAQTGINPETISEVILGQVLTAGCGQNPARQAVIKAGLPNMVPAFVVGKVCGSGLKATHLAAQAIKCGDAQIVIAGGQENMSAAPHALNGSRDGFRMGDAKLVDTMIVDGLWDVYNQYHMGNDGGERRQEARDHPRAAGRVRAASQNKAEAAQKAGKFKDEILPFDIVGRKGT